MKIIQLTANIGHQKNYKNLLLFKTFCTFHSNDYEQYFNPVIAKKKALKEIVKQKKYCKQIIGKIGVLLNYKRTRRLCVIHITQEDIDRTKEQMYPKNKSIKLKAKRKDDFFFNRFFHPYA